MEVISIDNREYVRAAQLAKRYKYTTDYIGQLCRGGKVDAKLVGRTWYVNPESLEGHRTTRYVKTSSDEKTNGTNVKINISRQDVEPVVRKETVKSLANTQRKSSNFLRRIEWKPLKYEVDTADLLPPLYETKEPTRVTVEMAEATKVSIKNLSKDTELVTEALPEVALTGSLRVASLDDNFEKDLENIDISDDFPSESEVDSDFTNEEPELVVPVSAPQHRRVAAASRVKADPQNPTYPVAIRQSDRPSFAPARVSATSAAKVTPQGSSWTAVITVFLLAACAAVALLCIELSISATSVGGTTSFSFAVPTF